MEQLLATIFDPNVVYLALVLSFILIFFAVVVPGTGLVEVAALFVVAFAAVGVYTLADQVNLFALAILILGVVPFLLAMRKSGRAAYLIFSLLALAVGSAYLFSSDRWWLPRLNLPMVLLVTVLNTTFLWIVVRKSLEANLALPRQDLARLIGQEGVAESEVHAEGTVRVLSELWTATSPQTIPAGSRVRVVARNGLTLSVELVLPAPNGSNRIQA